MLALYPLAAFSCLGVHCKLVDHRGFRWLDSSDIRHCYRISGRFLSFIETCQIVYELLQLDFVSDSATVNLPVVSEGDETGKLVHPRLASSPEAVGGATVQEGNVGVFVSNVPVGFIERVFWVQESNDSNLVFVGMKGQLLPELLLANKT